MSLEERISSSVDHAVEEMTSRLDADVRALVRQLVGIAVEDRDGALTIAREATLQLFAEEAKRRHEDVDSRTRTRVRELEAAMVGRLLASVRHLDAATTLSEVLDALLAALVDDDARAALFVVRPDRLQGWRLSGFGTHDALARTLVIDLNAPSVLSRVVRERSALTSRQSDEPLPSFAEPLERRLAIALPVVVGGRTVAAAYADREAEDVTDLVPWAERAELIVRHAARCLEAITAHKASRGTSAHAPGTHGQAGAVA